MRVLIIGSLAAELGVAAKLAIARGAQLLAEDDVARGLARLRADGRIDCVLCDVTLDVGELVRALRAERMVVPVVACGTSTDPGVAVAAIRAGAREFLPLPPDADLIAAILSAVAADNEPVAPEQAGLNQTGPVFRDPAMLAVIARAEMVARSDASVLISGESGTGKEVVARLIHRASPRAAKPFVALNCAAIPETLLESELFGHERGAFSGAVARRVGKFEAADGGTLLLDEISEMDVRLQAKLLRAVQEREIDRVGGSGPVAVDVRILATTNRDLAGEVAREKFRADLYFRLNVVSLRLPSLRERPGDIEPLAAHFARRYAAINGVAARTLTERALSRLRGHAWPGNARELENAIHRAVLMAEGSRIDADDLDFAHATPPQAAMATDAVGMVGRKMEDVERDLIIGTLSHTLGNRTHAATILGISIRALRNKLRDYAAHGIAVPPPTAGISVPLPRA